MTAILNVCEPVWALTQDGENTNKTGRFLFIIFIIFAIVRTTTAPAVALHLPMSKPNELHCPGTGSLGGKPC